MRGSLGAFTLLLLAAGTAYAAEAEPLTLELVIEIAREHAPAVRVARTRVEEARAGVVGARVLQSENPSLQGGIGPRWADSRTTDVELGLAVPIDLGSKRSKRIRAAETGAVREQHLAADAARISAGMAVSDYYRTLHAHRTLALATERLTLAKDVHQTAVDRQKAGDIARFEVNLADAEVARAESQVAAARGAVARTRADLAATLGLGSIADRKLEGELTERTLFDALTRTGSQERPDVKAARAGVDLAAAELSLAQTKRWPELALRLTYAHEDEADLMLGGFSITLPFFERGQGARGQASARREQAKVELETRARAASSTTEGARAAYAAAVEAVSILETRAQPKAIENETMARDGYRAGKIDLASLLLIRRDALETRREYIDRLLEAALAGVDLWVAVGAP